MYDICLCILLLPWLWFWLWLQRCSRVLRKACGDGTLHGDILFVSLSVTHYLLQQRLYSCGGSSMWCSKCRGPARRLLCVGLLLLGFFCRSCSATATKSWVAQSMATVPTGTAARVRAAIPPAATAPTTAAGEQEGSGDKHAERTAEAHHEDREQDETTEAPADAASGVGAATITSCCGITWWLLLRRDVLRAQQASDQGSLQGSILVIRGHSRNGVAAPRREGIDRPHDGSADKAKQPEKTVRAEDEK